MATITASTVSTDMQVHTLTAFDDNYIWMLEDGLHAWVVDPGDAQPVLRSLAQHQLTLSGILITHHHGDHTGGVAELQQAFPGLAIHGPANETLRFECQRMNHGDVVDVLGVKFETIDVPGHTAGHVAYFGQPEGHAPMLFCGDTLFSGGCGRVFEGTPSQMYASLSTLGALPITTQIFCAHEYTLANLRFAIAVEPNNSDLLAYVKRCQDAREHNQPTIPSTLATELAINPFLRCKQPEVIAAALHHQPDTAATPEAAFATLRAWKNTF